ncbi:MAG: hypothetical protein IPJ16_05705 [Bacteroidales bacterium]|nr:hypothetical protein [Bacteroidales bacterium]
MNQRFMAYRHLDPFFTTDRGFTALVDGLNEYGFSVSDDPFLRVNLSMVTTASDILTKQIMLSEYEGLFAKNTTRNQREALMT